jgi:enoyl-CoA hydratase
MTLLDYALDDGVATISMDDGRANALSPAMLDAIGAALDRAEKDAPTGVVLAGRPGRFSGGFDLAVLGAGGPDAERMLRGGFTLAERLLAFPPPVVVACTGHAMAMGSFLLCAVDYRVAAAGDFKIQANEVAIGLTMPLPALALLRYRLTPAAFDRAVGLAELFTPAAAAEVGFVDRVVAADDVVSTAQAVVRSFEGLDAAAHLGSKLRARSALLEAVRAGIESEFGTG